MISALVTIRYQVAIDMMSRMNRIALPIASVCAKKLAKPMPCAASIVALAFQPERDRNQNPRRDRLRPLLRRDELPAPHGLERRIVESRRAARSANLHVLRPAARIHEYTQNHAALLAEASRQRRVG